jgi:histidyl-tRNA synthetase
MIDAEVISIMVNLFKIIGLTGIKVNLNSVGDKESREKYRDALVEYFRPYLDELCEDCKTRFLKNPLRMLDCKVDGEKEIMKNAPKITDYLNENSKEHFEKVQKYLSAMNIDFTINPNVVRGLDYYTNTVFEVEADIKGSQNVLGAGGRYNNLVENLGGPSIPGIGFAIGVDRLFLALEEKGIDLREKYNLDVYAFAMSENENENLVTLVNYLRMNGFNVDMDYNNVKIKNNFSKADKLNTRYIMIVGEDEVKNNYVTVKENKTKEEFKVDLENIIEFLDEKIEGYNEN